MKKSVLAALSALISLNISARTLNICCGDVTYAIPASGMGEAVSNGNGSITVAGRTLSVGEISGMYVDNSTVSDNTVDIVYSGNTAKVTIAGNIAQYVTATVTGAYVAIAQSDLVGETTCGEITYTLSGESADGAFSLSGTYKAGIELNGLSLASTQGAALDIQNGKRITISAKSGTVNSLTDAAGGTQKGAVACKGHIEFRGKGTLNICGNTSHAVYAKEYVEIKNCTLNITKAVKDGINCSQYMLLESGEVNISGIGDDGIQTDFKDELNRDSEDTATITIAGGRLNIAVTAAAAKALKAEGDVEVTGGDIIASVSGKGMWDSENFKAKASSCIKADGNCTLTAGNLDLSASGSGGKGINCNGTLTIDGGNVRIKTTGGMFAYVNGKEYDGYTGNTDRIASTSKSSPKGIKADTEIIINAGTVDVTTSGNGGEGIESKGELTINGGNISVRAYDDAINSSGNMYVKGGDVTVIATNNDGLDSNGNLYIMGGTILAFGASAPECGIDANEEGGYTVIFTGGTLLAAGGGNSVPSTAESTQPYVSGSNTLTAGTEVMLKSGDTVLASFTVPSDYKSSSSGSGGGRFPGGGGGMNGGGLLITCAGLTSGSSYTLVSGTLSATVTAALRGSGGGGGRPW